MNFRRVVIALAAIALFASLASAQSIIPNALTCSVSSSATPSLRAEGKTELTGDVLIRCTGGTAPLVMGAGVADAVDITVDLGTPFTGSVNANALVGTTTFTATEALLVVDDPNAQAAGFAVANYGMNAPVKFCAVKIPSGSSGSTAPACTTKINNSASPLTTGYWVADDGTGVAPALGATAANTFQGVLTGANKVTFYGVPVVPPVSSGVYRQFRITNLRVAPGTATINATVSVGGTGASLLQMSGSLQTAVGTGVAGLTASEANNGGGVGASNFSVCITPSDPTVALAAGATLIKPHAGGHRKQSSIQDDRERQEDNGYLQRGIKYRM